MTGKKPWLDEEDEYQFQIDGVDCWIRRAYGIGVLCGYIAIENGHPWRESYADDIDVDIHWGLTFSGVHPLHESSKHWVGFDCGHAGDLDPMLAPLWEEMGVPAIGVYRDVNFVKSEIKKLVAQYLAAKK